MKKSETKTTNPDKLSDADYIRGWKFEGYTLHDKAVAQHNERVERIAKKLETSHVRI